MNDTTQNSLRGADGASQQTSNSQPDLTQTGQASQQNSTPQGLQNQPVQNSEFDQPINTSEGKKKRLVGLLLLIGLLVLFGIGGGVWFAFIDQKDSDSVSVQVTSDESITILWAEWAPSEYLKALVKDFTKETGIQVKVETLPWSDFQKIAYEELESKSIKYDLVVGDSQWIGWGAKYGHYVQLTDWIVEKNVDESMVPVTVTSYGEYPKGSKKYYSVPLEGDALGWAYRKDLFEDPNEKTAFRAKYGYELSIPQTWEQVEDIAEFFYRPKENRYGIGIPTGVEHDPLTMGVETLIWAYGGNLGDYKTHKVDGILNSKESAAGLSLYQKLYKLAPPGFENAFYTVSHDAFIKGQIPMFMSYFAFFPDLEDPKKNPYYDNTGYFKMPAGPKGRFAALGGQGISVVSYTKKKDAAFAFLDWIIKYENQEKWAALGGFSCNQQVLASEKFLNATRFNRPFAESMSIVKDFWADPEYGELLGVSQKYFHSYVVKNDLTAEQSLNNITKEWEEIFELAGYYKQ